MARVKISGWQPGFEKIGHTKALQEFCHLSLAGAKDMTDRVLNGEAVDVSVSSVADANALVAKLKDLGANAQIIE